MSHGHELGMAEHHFPARMPGNGGQRMGWEGKAIPQIPFPSDWGTFDDVASAAMTPSSHGIGKLTPRDENHELTQSRGKALGHHTASACPLLHSSLSVQFPSAHVPGLGTSLLPDPASDYWALQFRTSFSETSFACPLLEVRLHLPVPFSRWAVGFYHLLVLK